MDLIKPQNLTITAEQLAMLVPYLVVALGAMLTLIVGVFKNHSQPNLNKISSFVVSLLTVVAGIYSLFLIWGEPSQSLFNNMLAADYFSTLVNLILMVVTGLVLVSSYSYLEKEGLQYIEYYSLVLFALLGMMLLASSLDLVVLFVALEIMSIAVYILVGFRRFDVKSNEAAIKYFLLGSVASAIFLYGIALIYAAVGSMNIIEIGTALKSITATTSVNPMLALGSILLVFGFLFKVASVPFHMWMPDVYEGAPTTITNFMTTGLKAAAFASFLRVFMSLGFNEVAQSTFNSGLHDVLWVVAIITMFFGNVIALAQRNIKRMLAYSSIAHTGYILVGFLAGGHSEYGFASIMVYLIAYVLMNVGAFTVVSMIGEQGDRNIDLQDFAGLGFKYPALGFAMTVFMFSMAGVPPTLGFAGKYLIFSSAVQSGEIWLTVLAVLCSAISAYFYLRVIVFMYMKEQIRERSYHFALPASLVVFIATLGTLAYGLFPNVIIHAAKKAAGI